MSVEHFYSSFRDANVFSRRESVPPHGYTTILPRDARCVACCQSGSVRVQSSRLPKPKWSLKIPFITSSNACCEA